MRAQANMAWRSVDLYAIIGSGDDQLAVPAGRPKPLAYGAEPPRLLRVDIREAKQLMDDLWEAGVRPSESVIGPNKGELASVREHLDDIRRLAFGVLEIAEPDRRRR